MSTGRWSIASAKAEFSRVVRRAQREPQVIEKRGEPTAVVLAIDEYERLSERARAARRWRAFLDLSAALGEEGGFDLEIPPRPVRPSPLARTRR